MRHLWLLLLCGWVWATPESGMAANKFLDKAKKAYQDLDYEKVTPLLQKALKIAASDEEFIDIYTLMGIMHVTYDRNKQAIEAFKEVLKRKSDFQLPPDTSPKIVAVLDSAREQNADSELIRESPKTQSPPVEQPADVKVDNSVSSTTNETTNGSSENVNSVVVPAKEPSIIRQDSILSPTATSRIEKDEPVYKKWWFWTAIGVVVIGAGGGYAAYRLSQPNEPSHDYGPISLPGGS